MNEWIEYSRGGVYCSNCGLLFNDVYIPAPLNCPCCNETVKYESEGKIIDDKHRLIKNAKILPVKEYPDWLLRKKISEEIMSALFGFGLPSTSPIKTIADMRELSEYLYDKGFRQHHRCIRVRKVKKTKGA